MTRCQVAAGLYILISEVTKGALIGIMARYFLLALEFAATLAASASGINGMPGVPVEGAEAIPSFGSLVTVTATTLFFIMDLHWEVLRTIVESYRVLPVGSALPPDFTMQSVAGALSKSFLLALQVCGPFIIYTISVNVLFGIANKLTPQVPVYFVSLPFVILGGLVVLYFIVADFLRIFIQGFENWLVTVPGAKLMLRVWPAPVKARREVSSLNERGQRAMSKLLFENEMDPSSPPSVAAPASTVSWPSSPAV